MLCYCDRLATISNIICISQTAIDDNVLKIFYAPVKILCMTGSPLKGKIMCLI